MQIEIYTKNYSIFMLFYNIYFTIYSITYNFLNQK